VVQGGAAADGEQAPLGIDGCHLPVEVSEQFQPRGMHPPPPGLGVEGGRREDGSLGRPVQVETDVADRLAGSRKSHTPNVRGCQCHRGEGAVLVAWHWLW
jgi:hypothetical protein